MKHSKILSIIAILSILVLGSCKTKQVATETETPNTSPHISYPVSIVQKDQETIIKNENQTLQLKADEFSIRFFNKKYDYENNQPYAAQIALFTEKEILNNISVGMDKEMISYFRIGTGIAASRENRYDEIYIDPKIHHYITYDPVEENKRADLISKKGDMLHLDFPVLALYMNDTTIPMNEIEMNQLYLIILIDINLNSIIDNGELTKVILKF